MDPASTCHSQTVRTYGEGPLLVYICGLDGTGELLFKQIPDLSKSHRVLTFRSRDSGQFTYEDLTDDIARMIEQQGVEKAVVLGESFGGTVALSFALRHQPMVERLVIVNSFARYPGRARLRLARLITASLPFRLIAVLRLVANTLGLYTDWVSREDRRRFFSMMRTVSREGYARRLRLIWELNIVESLSEIQVPVLFIAADRDVVVPSVKQARDMSRRIEGSKLVELKGSGHACLLGDRVKLAAILEEWIGG